MRAENGQVSIIWAGWDPIWKGSIEEAKELQRMLEIIAFHGELDPTAVLRLTREEIVDAVEGAR